MSNISALAAFITELGVILGVVIWVTSKSRFFSNGIKCLLRSEILAIYYKHKDSEKIRQYEYENFVFLYEAYKSLGGNSFIDKIYEEVKTWEVIT